MFKKQRQMLKEKRQMLKEDRYTELIKLNEYSKENVEKVCEENESNESNDYTHYTEYINDYITKKQSILNTLLNPYTIKKIIHFSEKYYNIININNKKLIERKVLLFLVIILTGIDLNLLLNMIKLDITNLFIKENETESSDCPYYTYVLDKSNFNDINVHINNHTSKVHYIQIKQALWDELYKKNIHLELITEIKESFIFKGDFFNRKDDLDYMFSPLSNDKKPMTKSNLIKDLKDFLNLLQNNNILDSEVKIDDLFLNLNLRRNN